MIETRSSGRRGRAVTVRDWSERRAQLVDDYLQFRAELRAALRLGTPAALREVLRRWGGLQDASLKRLARSADPVLEPAIRQLILREPLLADLHDGARRWLEQRATGGLPARAVVPADGRRTWPLAS